MKNLIFIIGGLLFLTTPAVAQKKFYAKVTVLKGRVSQLPPGAHSAVWVKKGDYLKEDTSLVTRDRSFIKVKVLGDGSNVTLGPDSKLVLNKLKKAKGSVVSLLTGTIRAKINKRKNAKKKETKFYIRTQSAALGVRGTEFVVAVNQDNKVTSLVTLEGEVDMVKAETLRPDVKVEEEVEASLKTDKVTTVRKGRASTSYLHKEAVTAPQKVNPAQLVALKKNESLTQETKGQKVKSIKLTDAKKQELYAPDTAEEIASTTADVTKENVSGGFVDLKSAIFIPPTEDTEVKVGTVDSRSGQYIPPKGVKLDVIEGFVAMADTKDAREKAEKLKKLVEYRPLPKDYAGTHSGMLTAAYDSSWQFQFEAGINANFLKVKNLSNKGKSKFSPAPMPHFNLIARKPSTFRRAWRFDLRLKGLDADRGELDQAEKSNNDDFRDRDFGAGLGFGLEYKLAQDLLIRAMGYGEHELLMVQTIDNLLIARAIVRRVFVPKLEFSFDMPLNKNYTAHAGYKTIFSGSDSTTSITSGKGAWIALIRDVRNSKGEKSWYWRVKLDHTELDTQNVVHINDGLEFTYGKRF